MCGIGGFIICGSEEQAVSLLQRMNEAQRHRGPDRDGTAVLRADDAVVGLANTRLAVLDPSARGEQPMTNPDTGDVLVYNGEIYNFRELRNELTASGMTFRSNSDTEVVLRSFQRWGRACADRFRGMFAFAIWEAASRTLHLCRDHLGIKPLYVASTTSGGIVFASEVRALMRTGLVGKRIDRIALASYLAYGAVQEPHTIFEGVAPLPTRTWRSIATNGEVRDWQYWQPPHPSRDAERLDERELIEAGTAVFRNSVSRHCVSDVPVAVYLSSGIDSTAVLSAAIPSLSRATAFTVAFANDPNRDESITAAKTAARLGCEHTIARIDEDRAASWARDFLSAMDQPSMDGFNTYVVSRSAREHGFVVALSGQGGDEVFGGYPGFRSVPRAARFAAASSIVPAPLRRLIAAQLFRDPVRRLKAEDAVTARGLTEIYLQYRRLFSNRQLASLGFEQNGTFTRTYLPRETDLAPSTVDHDPTASVRLLEMQTYLRNTLLRDGDVYGMASSIEIRVPFLDRDLVDWALSLPGDVFLPPHAASKFILRRMAEDLVPADVLALPKVGFVPPFGRWLSGPLRDVLESGLDGLARTETMSKTAIAEIMKPLDIEASSAAGFRAWALCTLGHWMLKEAA